MITMIKNRIKCLFGFHSFVKMDVGECTMIINHQIITSPKTTTTICAYCSMFEQPKNKWMKNIFKIWRK